MIINSSMKDMKVSKVYKHSSKISDGLSKKNFLLQFLPTKLEYLESQKYVNFSGEKLKTAYLIDIVHNLVLKYYFKKENRFILNATILKDKYGYLYNYYINFLVENKILFLISNHRRGVSSRKYSIDTTIFNSKIKRYKNIDKVLLKKYKKKIYDTIDFSDSKNYLIPKEIREKLISDLFSVDIEIDRSIFFLNSLKDSDMDIYNRNTYSVESINDKHIFYHFDIYGRFHSNFTILRSFIRKNCLLISGNVTHEIDISNSQPLFLFKLISDSNTKWVNKDEIELFEIIVRNGNYYQYLIDNLKLKDKKQAKELTYKVLFGRNYKNCKYSEMFRSIFPTIYNYIRLYKNEMGDYRSLSYELQKMESNFIFNTLISKIMNINSDIKVITVHDSIIIEDRYKSIVIPIFENELQQYLS